MDIAVVGGSIGGLTAGCLLADAGHDVTIYERSPVHLEERGAGIGLLPTTSKYLCERKGLDPASISVPTAWIRTLRRDGSFAHAVRHDYRFSSWNTIYREMLRCFDPERYLLGHELVAIDPDTPGLEFANGAAVNPDFVVCADGVGSTARASLVSQATPDYAGYVAWRGVVEETALSTSTRAALDDAITYFVYANSHLLVYPIPGRDGSVEPGRRLINLVWYRNYSEGDDIDDLLLDRRGARRDVSVPPGAVRHEHIAEARAVASARLPACVAEVVHATDDLFIQVVFDLAVDRLVAGNTALIGDAAFSVRPHAAAGTAKAAADAWTLFEMLERHSGDLAPALAEWEPGQLALGRSLLERTRSVGRRSQFDNTWVAGDPDLIFGLYAPGD